MVEDVSVAKRFVKAGFDPLSVLVCSKCSPKLRQPFWGLWVNPHSTSVSKAHTKVKTSDPVRSRKLSTFGVCQYYGGGPRGNPDWP